ncbi:MAG: hypothetical protein GY854_26095 [Deltaproteobacteria bacterium]|nr:hypothetical protein [Deltaproteobacteria bacterium]
MNEPEADYPCSSQESRYNNKCGEELWSAEEECYGGPGAGDADGDTDGDTDGDADSCMGDGTEHSSFSIDDDIDEIILEEDYMYVLGGDDYSKESTLIAIADVSDPKTPRLVSGNGNAFDDAYCMAKEGDYLYVFTFEEYIPGINADSSIHVFDVSDPERDPPEVAVVGMSSSGYIPAMAQAVDGYIYLAAYQEYHEDTMFRIFDVSTPSNPVRVGTTTIDAGFPEAMLLGPDDTVYLGFNNKDFMESGSIRMVDVSYKQTPLIVGDTIDFDVPVQGLAAEGTRLFATTTMINPSDSYVGYLYQYDIEDSRAPVKLGELRVGDSKFFSITVDRNLAYVDDGSGLNLLNISDPENMSIMEHIYQDAYQIHLFPGDDSLLYIYDSWYDQIRVYDRCPQPQ